MVLWLSLAALAQFLFAATTLVDKHVVVRAAHIGQPIVYAFFVSLMSGAVVLVAPFVDIALPSLAGFSISFLSAGAFVFALFFFYSALKLGRASDIAPIVGAISAIVTLPLAAFFIDGDAEGPLGAAIVLLAAGTALISRFHCTRRSFVYALAAGVLFGASIFLTKLVYLDMGFVSGFFWTRFLDIGVALLLLFSPSLRRQIFHGGTRSSQSAKAVIVGNKIIGGIASVVTAYAVSLGSVAVVNALSGLQFVFLFFFALLFGKYMPSLRDSGGISARGHGGWHTGFGVALIVLGFALVYAGARV